MRTFLVAIAGLMLFAGSPALANVAITVNKDTQTMTVAVDGVTKYRWPVSTGIPSRETPNGTFKAFRMEADHFSKEFDDAPMPHSIFFTKIGHAIHGTMSEGRLGTPASHGCVRLSRANATTLYALVQEQGVLNTTVTLTGSAAVALARNPRPTHAIGAARSAPAQQPSEQQQYASSRPARRHHAARSAIWPAPASYAQERPDDGYIYPADGSATDQRYPAPTRRLFGAQVYQQQQYRSSSIRVTTIRPMRSRSRAPTTSRGSNIISRAAIIRIEATTSARQIVTNFMPRRRNPVAAVSSARSRNRSSVHRR